jgi:hypothetical protein
MPRSRPFERTAVSLLLVVSLVALALQLIGGGPVAGALGLVLLAVPGYAISRTIGPRPLGWPEVLMVALGAALTLTVLVGIIAGLTPAGLDSRTIATVELLILAAISIAWFKREFRGGVEASAGRPSTRIALGTLLLGGLGVILAGTGFVVAMRAAQDQQHPGFVQFWTLPARPSAGASVGVRNLSGVELDCAVTIDRPDREGLSWNAGRVMPGQTVTGPLPPAEPAETAPWRLALECTGATGAVIERQVSINPPQ